MDNRLIEYLATRRSIPPAQMGDPAPDGATLRGILTMAARVPDHGKLAPWRFITYDGASRAPAIDGLKRIAAQAADEKERRFRSDKTSGFADAPLIVAVVSAPISDHPKIPLWEQQLSAGAVCLNLLHAAAAHGFAAQWLTGWYGYDADAARWLGVREGERVAGFIHMGTSAMQPTDRDRPDIDAITSEWRAPGGG